MPIKKNHQDRCLRRSLIFFLLALVMLIYLTTPLSVKLATMAFFSWLGYPWNYLIANVVPIVLFFLSFIVMNVFFIEGKDGYTVTPNWKVLMNVCLSLSIVLPVVGMIYILYLLHNLNAFFCWLGFEALFVNAFILCKIAYDKENPKNVAGRKPRNI